MFPLCVEEAGEQLTCFIAVVLAWNVGTRRVSEEVCSTTTHQTFREPQAGGIIVDNKRNEPINSKKIPASPDIVPSASSSMSVRRPGPSEGMHLMDTSFLHPCPLSTIICSPASLLHRFLLLYLPGLIFSLVLPAPRLPLGPSRGDEVLFKGQIPHDPAATA